MVAAIADNVASYNDDVVGGDSGGVNYDDSHIDNLTSIADY